MPDQVLLEVKNLSISFQTSHSLVPVVENLSFNINSGKTLALVGESGSGKSMTALAIMQLLPNAARISHASEIFFQQQDLLLLPEISMRKIRGGRIAMIFQEALAALNPVLTIEQQIKEVLRSHLHLSKQAQQNRILELLETVGIPDPNYYAKTYPHQLSGGLRQRAMIAIALAADPLLLIADEPTTALDVTIQAQVLKLLQDIQAKTNMSLLFITHDLGIVSQMADEVVVLKQGHNVEHASAKKFFAQPQHEYSKKLFASLLDMRTIVHNSAQNSNCFAQKSIEKPLLQVKNLQVYFPIRRGVLKRTIGYIKAVDDVSLTLDSGKTLALVGESGSGKTTLGRAILQLIKPTAGEVKFDNLELTNIKASTLRALRQKFQIVFQDPYTSLDPRMIINDIIEEGMLIQKINKSPKQRQQRIDELLSLVGLEPDYKFRYPHEFSGGQRQRICIARALAVEPQLLICDEPTSALDVSIQMQILNLLRRLQQELNLSYLLITHNFGVVAYLADQVAVMQYGKIIEQGTTEKILFNPEQKYTQQLLAAVPKIPKDEY
jgi:ABC-type microcin C transport system duplicated ATPase subunit YejF